MSDHEQFFTPFGPVIMKTQLTQATFDILRVSANSVRGDYTQDFRDKLAGNLEEEFRLNFKDPNEKQSVYEELVSYAKMYVNKARGMYRVKRFGSIKAKNLRLADPIWVNFMKAGEWNPSHFHHGVISLVAYLSVPPEIKIEREEAEHSIKSNQPTAGKIQWTYGESMHFSQTYYTATPQEGQVWLFPADLKHMVYPFKSDVERVSISCNIEAPNFEINKII